MGQETTRKWLDRLRQRRRQRRERKLERQRHRTAHQRDLERAGKVGGSMDIGAGGSP
jgi:uncharacterized membrane protein